MLKPKTACLVTGGAGFVGSHLSRRLTELDCDVRVVDNLSTGKRENLAAIDGQIDFILGDLRDPEICRRAVQEVELVFHVAALPSVPRSLADPWESHDANVNATMRLLEASRRQSVRRVVYSSSSSVYGDTPTLPKVEEMEPTPRSPYAVSKLASEQYVAAFARAGVLSGVALRYFNVFGPRQDPRSAYAAVIPAFLDAALRGVPATMYGDGSQTRDFTYVDNVVDANIRAAVAPSAASGAVVNIGAGTRTSLRDLIEVIRRVTGVPLEWKVAGQRAGDVKDSLAGLARARAVIGYEPSVGLEEGLRSTWEWMRGAAGASMPAPEPAAAKR